MPTKLERDSVFIATRARTIEREIDRNRRRVDDLRHKLHALRCSVETIGGALDKAMEEQADLHRRLEHLIRTGKDNYDS